MQRISTATLTPGDQDAAVSAIDAVTASMARLAEQIAVIQSRGGGSPVEPAQAAAAATAVDGVTASLAQAASQAQAVQTQMAGVAAAASSAYAGIASKTDTTSGL